MNITLWILLIYAGLTIYKDVINLITRDLNDIDKICLTLLIFHNLKIKKKLKKNKYL
jgi:hypothetical protein